MLTMREKPFFFRAHHSFVIIIILTLSIFAVNNHTAKAEPKVYIAQYIGDYEDKDVVKKLNQKIKKLQNYLSQINIVNDQRKADYKIIDLILDDSEPNGLFLKGVYIRNGEQFQVSGYCEECKNMPNLALNQLLINSILHHTNGIYMPLEIGKIERIDNLVRIDTYRVLLYISWSEKGPGFEQTLNYYELGVKTSDGGISPIGTYIKVASRDEVKKSNAKVQFEIPNTIDFEKLFKEIYDKVLLVRYCYFPKFNLRAQSENKKNR